VTRGSEQKKQFRLPFNTRHGDGYILEDPNCHTISSFPTDLHLHSFCRAGCKRLLTPLFPRRQSHPASAAATGTHPFCPTYLSNPGFMALSTSLSKRFHSVQYSSSRSTERRFTTIISARFLCAWQRIYLYLFRKYICSGKPPSPQKHMVYICNPAPRCSNPPGPSRKTSSPRPWQPYSLSQDP